MPHREPTIRSRELGEGLRQIMQDASLSGKEAAKLLDVSPSFVSMLLSGADTALSEGQSRELIAALATELYADGEDHDDRA